MSEYTLIKSSTDEVLRITPDGEFIWHPDADRLIEEWDINNSPAMKHILRALRAKRKWVGLTPEERDEIHEKTYGALPHHVAFHHAIEQALKEKNT